MDSCSIRPIPKEKLIVYNSNDIKKRSSSNYRTHNSRILSAIYKIASRIIKPAENGIYWTLVHRRKGEGFGKELGPGGVSRRFSRLKAAAWFTTSLVIFPLTILGFLTKRALHPGRGKDTIRFMNAANNAYHPPEVTDKLHIATYNVACLPTPIDAVKDVYPAKPRMKELAQWLNEQEKDQLPLCIGLQEAFDQDSSEQLCQDTKHLYPYAITSTGWSKIPFLGTNSGLQFHSRVPIKSAAFYAFEDLVGLGVRCSARGFLKVELDLGKGKSAVVYVAHAQPHADSENTRHNEVELITRQMRYDRYTDLKNGINRSGNYFLMGDLNVGNMDDETGVLTGEYDRLREGILGDNAFHDPFLTEHETNGTRKAGTEPAFLPNDIKDAPEGADIKEPLGSFYCGADQKDRGEEKGYGTKEFYSGPHTTVANCRYDYVLRLNYEEDYAEIDPNLVPEADAEGTAEIRHILPKQLKTTPISDHLLLSACYKIKNQNLREGYNMNINNNYKPIKLVEMAPVNKSTLTKHVEWMSKDRKGIAAIAVKALAALECLVAALSLVGIPILFKAYNMARTLQSVKNFEGTYVYPPVMDKISLKTPTQTFNHTHDFVIYNDTIWTRPRGDSQYWKKMYFDGYAEGKKPVTLHADGANLIVLDEDNCVHYKKVLQEYRLEEIGTKLPKHKLVRAQIEDINAHPYIATDKALKNNWKDKWFSLPVVHLIANLITGKKLKIPQDARAWAISQRGRYNNFLEDSVGQPHPVGTGVTTLYILTKNGKEILKYDPWSPKLAKMNISVPETAEATYEAINMTASASTIMLIGYETTAEGEGTTKTLKIKTKLADIDSEGWNPGLKYDYFKNENDKDVRVMPLPAWQDHPLVLEGFADITKNITIIQTGEGNDARELRVEGRNEKGEEGYYYKAIDAHDWSFKSTGEAITNDPLETIINETEPFESTVHNYKATDIKLNRSNERMEVTLSNFGKHSYDSTIKCIQIGEDSFEFQLHKKKTLKNFFGFNGEHYDFIIPEQYWNNEKIKNIFGNKKSFPVNVSEKNGVVTVSARGYFKIKFEK